MIKQDGFKHTSILVLSTIILAQPLAMADSSRWNPMGWFGDSKSQAQMDQTMDVVHLEEARQRAEEAKRKAEEALMKAAEARVALEAAQQAMESRNAPVSRQKPLVEFPLNRRSNEMAETQQQDEEVISTPAVEEPATAEKSSSNAQSDIMARMNPMNWFKSPASGAETTGAGKASRMEAESLPALSEPPAKKQNEPANIASRYAGKAAIIETERGNIAIELYPDEAPETVANFMSLAENGFYNKFNMKFHRVVPGFVIQTGDPTGTGAGGSQKRIPLEVKNKLSHDAKGMVAMARGPDPNSATSQFYITLTPQPSLDGKYAVFGKVISGLDVLDKIEKSDMLYGVRVVDVNSVARDPVPVKEGMFSKLF